MQKLLCNGQKFRRNAMHNIWLAEEMKFYSRFHGLPSNRQNSFNTTATSRPKAQAITTTPQKTIVRETNFHI